MSFFPEREPALDQDVVADFLTEYGKTNSLGWWTVDENDPNLTLGFDYRLANIISRNAALYVRKKVVPNDPQNVDLIFTFNEPFNMENWQKIVFSIKTAHIGEHPVLTGTGRFLLFDVNDNYAYLDFAHGVDEPMYRARYLSIPSFWAEYSPEVGRVFAWKYVKKWIIRLHIEDVPQHWPPYDAEFEAWIDAGPFMYRDPLYFSTIFEAYEGIDSVNRNLTVTSSITGEVWTYPTPFLMNLLQNDHSEYLIEAPPTRFQEWEDHSTNPTRIYVPESDKTLTAYYEPLVKHNLSLTSDPSGKQISVGGVTFQTPKVLGLSPGTYTINAIDTQNFLRWENGDTNPSRTLSVQADTTIKAYFSGGSGYDSDLLKYVLLGGVGLGASYLAYRTLKKKR